MTAHQPSPARVPGVTLVEMTLVILVMLTLIGVGTFSVGKISEWKLGKKASETLRVVHTAQRIYLSDHPTKKVTDITAADIIPYMPDKSTTMPTVESLEGAQLGIKVNVIPPVVASGGGGVYDPSGSSTDSLWDVGE